MNLKKLTGIRLVAFTLIIPIVLLSLAGEPIQGQVSRKSSDEILLEIMDLHSDLVTSETFLAQAKMLGAYLESAQSLEEAKKIKIYGKVLEILTKIKEYSIQIPPKPSQKEGEVGQKILEGKQKDKSVYEPGAALLEIFKIDPEKREIPDLPVIRTYWKRDLAYSGFFPLPDHASKVGRNSPYVAKFSFYYEAKKAGKYGFTLIHFCDSGIFDRHQNACKLTIGNVDIVEVSSEPVGQGVCDLKKGFHRVEFLLISKVPYWHDVPGKQMANFKVEIMTPDAFDTVPITKDMMLLKKE